MSNKKNCVNGFRRKKQEQCDSERIKCDKQRTPLMNWDDVKVGFKKFAIKRWNSIGSWSPDGGSIDLTNFHVSDANYTKRKNVFRLSSTNSSGSGIDRELLIQAQSSQDMQEWEKTLSAISLLQENSGADYLNNLGSQTAEPQRIAAVQSVQLNGANSGNDDFVLQTKTVRKLGSRSPSGQSPVTKSRKTPQNFSVSSSSSSYVHSKEETGSPKQKSWKIFVTQQFKKIQNQSDTDRHPMGASIGVPLSMCLPSEENVYVPLIVAKCTLVVETKGLNIVGIYRIPGNTAAMNLLSERINQNGMDEQTWKDPRFDDVNVVSSLLKLFIRSLPDPLLPIALYHSFIAADKLTDEAQRLNEIKHLLKKLPVHNYETLKHLVRHLNCVSQNSMGNLMDRRNLSIVFGPSIVRNSNLELAVKHMKHQCCIVESLLTYYSFFFENDPLPQLKEKPHLDVESGSEIPSAEFLLENVAKIEPFNKESSSRFMSNIVQAANRKIRKIPQRRSTSSVLSLDSTTSTESKERSIKLKQHSEAARSSEEEDSSAFADNGSMSLKLITTLLDDKLRSIRNSSVDSEEKPEETTKPTTAITNPASNAQTNFNNFHQLNQPLKLGKNIPFADDESPERPLIQARIKPMRVSTTIQRSPIQLPIKNVSRTSSSSTISEDSTTSNHKDIGMIRLDSEVLRKVNRILTNLEHLERKYSLNRSHSLNYKNHRKIECCCNHRLSLTKEKSDKNISKRRQLYESSQQSNNRKRGSRSIRRRHTIQGTIGEIN